MSGKPIAAVAAIAATMFTTVSTTGVLADPDCTCRGLGRNFEVGETACLETPRGPRIATCGMALNNTSWLFSDTPCVSARADPPAIDEQADAEKRLSRLR